MTGDAPRIDWKTSAVCRLGHHGICGGWQCLCDCHDDEQPITSVPVNHGEHDPAGWTQVGPCIYCSCGERFGQGDLPAEKDRRAMAQTSYEVHITSMRMFNSMIEARRAHKGLT